MRSVILAASLALAAAPALASTPSGGPATPSTSGPSAAAASAGNAQSRTSTTAGAPTASAAADANATAPASFQAGQSVQDNTGANIGTISKISADPSGQQMAVIKMGKQTFQVPTNRLGVTNGSAEINLTQAQILAMLKTTR